MRTLAVCRADCAAVAGAYKKWVTDHVLISYSYGYGFTQRETCRAAALHSGDRGHDDDSATDVPEPAVPSAETREPSQRNLKLYLRKTLNRTNYGYCVYSVKFTV